MKSTPSIASILARAVVLLLALFGLAAGGVAVGRLAGEGSDQHVHLAPSSALSRDAGQGYSPLPERYPVYCEGLITEAPIYDCNDVY
jgi:hypothetical protein